MSTIVGTPNQIDAVTVGTTTTLSLASPLVPPGDVDIASGYLHVSDWGSIGASAPVSNTNVGDFTVNRISLGGSSMPLNVALYGDITRTTPTNFVQISGHLPTTVTGDSRCAQFTMSNTGATASFGNYICSQNVLIHDAPVSITNLHCIHSLPSTTANFTANANIGQLNGLRINPVHQGAGTIGTLNGIFFQQGATTGGTISNYNAMWIGAINSSSIKKAAAIKIDGVSSGTVSNYGIWFNTNGSSQGTGIVFGTAGDTSLWRGAAGQLLTPGDWSAKHYLCSSIPIVTVETAAGMGATATISGNDHGFLITLNTGTAPSMGALFTVKFGNNWPSAPHFVHSGFNATAAALSGTNNPFLSSIAIDQLVLSTGSAPLAASTQYKWQFVGMN